MAEESPYYTVQELADRWHYTPSAIRRKIRQGHLVFTRVGHKYLFLKEDVHRMEKISSGQ